MKHPTPEATIDLDRDLFALIVELERERAAMIEAIAEWANDEGISFDATSRLSRALGLDK